MEDPFRTIEWKQDHIRLLDQTLLPREETYIEIRSVDRLCDAIKRLAVPRRSCHRSGRSDGDRLGGP